jgi:hypothetical protein
MTQKKSKAVEKKAVKGCGEHPAGGQP